MNKRDTAGPTRFPTNPRSTRRRLCNDVSEPCAGELPALAHAAVLVPDGVPCAPTQAAGVPAPAPPLPRQGHWSCCEWPDASTFWALSPRGRHTAKPAGALEIQVKQPRGAGDLIEMPKVTPRDACGAPGPAPPGTVGTASGCGSLGPPPARLAPVCCFIRQTREERAYSTGTRAGQASREASGRGPTAGYGEGWARRSSLPPTGSVRLGAASEQVVAVSRGLAGICADPGERGRARQVTLSFSGLRGLAFAPP